MRARHLLRSIYPRRASRSSRDRIYRPRLSDRILNFLARRLTNTPAVWGSWDKVEIGEDVFLVNTLFNTSSGRIVVGDRTFFGHNVCLLTGTHHLIEGAGAGASAVPVSGRDIVIGTGVWIASNATVLGPCIVGDNVVIAAGAVVTGGELEAGGVYAGIPARRIK